MFSKALNRICRLIYLFPIRQRFGNRKPLLSDRRLTLIYTHTHIYVKALFNQMHLHINCIIKCERVTCFTLFLSIKDLVTKDKCDKTN